MNSSSSFAAICIISLGTLFLAGCSSSIGSMSTWHASGPEFDPMSGTFFHGHKNISTAILPLRLIQEEQLSVTGERMCTKYW